MKVRDYRREVEAELERTQARAATERRGPAVADAETWEAALATLKDRLAKPESRLAALYTLQAGAFDLAKFAPFAAAFVAALQTIAQAVDETAELRRAALDHLANTGDTIASRVLIEGLEGSQPAAVPPAAALEMLARDDHGSAVRIARKMLDVSEEVQVREQAVRILGSDPTSADRLETMMKDTGEANAVRRASAVALRALSPNAFGTAAHTVLGNEADTEIDATVRRGLRTSSPKQL
jgi:hypothetical protein